MSLEITLPSAPVLNDANVTGQAGLAFSYTIPASNNPTSFNATGLPAGLAINTSNGVISGTPASGGISNVTISATNAGGTGSATLTLTINTLPAITSSLSATSPVGQAFSYTITATNSPTGFNATNLPPGLQVNANNGGISGTPTSVGLYNVTISATNAGGTATSTLVLAISPPAPTAAALTTFTDSVISGLSANWGANGNPAGTAYNVQISTDQSFVTGTSSISVAANSAAFTGLLANTTYYGRVEAYIGPGLASGFMPLLPTTGVSTLAAAPTAPAANTVTATSMILSWNANSNPAGTAYVAQISTNGAFASISAASATLNTSAMFSGLTANTTYFLRVEAENNAGVPTQFAVALASSTRVVAPVSAAPPAATANAITAHWGSNGNSATTLYIAQISTDPTFVSFNASSQTLSTAATFSGLNANTAYFCRVAAFGNDGALTPFTALPSTSTLLLPPAATGATFVAVTTASARIAWGDGGNGAGTLYNAQISTDNFVSVNASSSTRNLGALFGVGGMGPALTPNTTYFFQVQATTASNASAFVRLGSTVTLANAPAATVALGVSSTAATVGWSANGNPAGTTYELWRDLTGAFSSPTKLVVVSTKTVVNGLAANTTYYFQVRARSYGRTYTAFDSPISTATMPPAPSASVAPAGVAVGVSSISWSWSAAPYATSYQALRAASGAVLASTPTRAFFDTGLATNTAYGLITRGVNPTGLGALSAPTTVYTLAAPPASTNYSGVTATSATLSWSLNTNPSATAAEVQRSTDSAIFISRVRVTTTSWIDDSLIGCTTYYFRLRNLNGDGVPTGFDTTHFTTLATTPAAPGTLGAAAVGGDRVALSWLPSPSEGIVGYHLYYDSGTGTPNVSLATFVSTQTSWTTGVLSSSAAYKFALYARQRCGVEETGGVYATAAATGTLPAVRAAIIAPDAGRRLNGDSISIIAGLRAGTVDEVQQVTFQYKQSSGTVWTNIPANDLNHPNPATSAPYFIHWDVTGLTGSYDLRAVALSVAGRLDTAPDVVTVTVDPINWDINEYTSGGKIRTEQLLHNAGSVIGAAGSGTGDPVAQIVLPAGALNCSTVTMTVSVNPVITTAAPTGSPVSALQIELSNNQSALSGGVIAVVTLSYPDTVADPADLQLWSLDPATGLWTQLAGVSVNTSSRTVSGNTPHFSIFALLPAAGSSIATNLDRVRVYPVPYKPNGSNADEGKPYSAGDPVSGIVFDNLPAAVTIKIYTMSGRLVAKLETSSGTGAVRWDARNSDGHDVASGGYFAVISTPGQKSVVKKLAIIR